jgi:hypothetical protein
MSKLRCSWLTSSKGLLDPTFSASSRPSSRAINEIDK